MIDGEVDRFVIVYMFIVGPPCCDEQSFTAAAAYQRCIQVCTDVIYRLAAVISAFDINVLRGALNCTYLLCSVLTLKVFYFQFFLRSLICHL